MQRPVRYTQHPGVLDNAARSIDTPDRHRWAQAALWQMQVPADLVDRHASVDELALAHDRSYVHGLRDLSTLGRPAAIDPELTVDAGTFTLASAAAGALIDATDRALDDPTPIRLCSSRPGSHHASSAFGMGFCVINNLAVAAHHALSRGLDRVAILDFDVHHGNGTQEIFWRDGRVLTVSMHQHPFFPGTGAADELGAGLGRGTNLNLPLSAGRDGRVAVPLWQRALDAMLTFQPQLVLFEAGLDAHEGDWTSDVHLDDHAFFLIGRHTGQALTAAGCPAVLELGGGYTEAAISGGLPALLQGLIATWITP